MSILTIFVGLALTFAGLVLLIITIMASGYTSYGNKAMFIVSLAAIVLGIVLQVDGGFSLRVILRIGVILPALFGLGIGGLNAYDMIGRFISVDTRYKTVGKYSKAGFFKRMKWRLKYVDDLNYRLIATSILLAIGMGSVWAWFTILTKSGWPF